MNNEVAVHKQKLKYLFIVSSCPVSAVRISFIKEMNVGLANIVVLNVALYRCDDYQWRFLYTHTHPYNSLNSYEHPPTISPPSTHIPHPICNHLHLTTLLTLSSTFILQRKVEMRLQNNHYFRNEDSLIFFELK